MVFDLYSSEECFFFQFVVQHTRSNEGNKKYKKHFKEKKSEMLIQLNKIFPFTVVERLISKRDVISDAKTT